MARGRRRHLSAPAYHRRHPGPDWIPRLESNDFRIENNAKQVLRSLDFKPSKPGTVLEAVILKGMLFKDNDRITKKIRTYAEAFRTPDKRKLGKPNAELACLIREKFPDKEIEAMGLWRIVTMHENINGSVGDPSLLNASRYDIGRLLDACFNYDRPNFKWPRDDGFAFVVSPACNA